MTPFIDDEFRRRYQEEALSFVEQLAPADCDKGHGPLETPTQYIIDVSSINVKVYHNDLVSPFHIGMISGLIDVFWF